MPSGPRIRTDNVFGTVSDDPLTSGALTLHSDGLANLDAISSAHAVIVLDPLRAAGAPEVVFVTGHVGAATSATISRGEYGTAAREHAAGTLWVHAPTVEDLIRIVTSSTRPSDPFEGQVAYETDTNRWIGYDGSVWQPSLHNPPAVRATSAVTTSISNATWTAVSFTGADDYDTDSLHDPSSNSSRITIRRPGLYHVEAGVGFTANATGGRGLGIRKNGTGAAGGTGPSWGGQLVQAVAGAVTYLNFSTTVKLAANDYIEVVVYQTSGGALTLNTGSDGNHWFAATWVGVG